jgi:amidase
LELPPTEVSDVRSLRIAVWFDEPSLTMDAEMLAILAAVADRCEAAGARVDRAARPQFDFVESWREGAWLIGAAVDISDGTHRVDHTDWLVKDRRRARRRQRWAEFFADYDVLLCPVTLTPAFEHLQTGEWQDRTLTIDGVTVSYGALESWPALIGSAYLPSTSTPVGRTSAGLPVGVQVVSPYLHDLRSIRVAGLLADLVGGGYVTPPIAR